MGNGITLLRPKNKSAHFIVSRVLSAPIIIKTPRANLSKVLEPPLDLNSLNLRAHKNAPSTSPIISGRRYWTTAARCNPSPPAISLRKQAMQKPILAGLPCKTRKTAIMPNNTPAVMIGYFSFKTSTSFLKIFKRNLKEIPKRTVTQFFPALLMLIIMQNLTLREIEIIYTFCPQYRKNRGKEKGVKARKTPGMPILLCYVFTA
jgi:hypothetical protein